MLSFKKSLILNRKKKFRQITIAESIYMNAFSENVKKREEENRWGT